MLAIMGKLSAKERIDWNSKTMALDEHNRYSRTAISAFATKHQCAFETTKVLRPTHDKVILGRYIHG